MAGCVIVDSKGCLLLLHRRELDRWEIPGGKVEVSDHETPVSAAVREGAEELGEIVFTERYLGQAAFNNLDGKDYEYHYFLTKIANNNVPMVSELKEFDDLQYMTRDRLYALKTKNQLSVFTLHILEQEWLEELARIPEQG